MNSRLQPQIDYSPELVYEHPERLLDRRRLSRAKVFAWTLLVISLVLGAMLAAAWRYIDVLEAQVYTPPVTTTTISSASKDPQPVSPLLLQYKLDFPGRGEVFPALTPGVANDYWPVAVLTVTNTAARPALQTVRAEIPGWSRPQTQTLVLGAMESRQLHLSPELLPRANENHEIRRAPLEVQVTGPDGDLVFAQTRPVYIHGASDIYWGKKFSNAQVVARWVTPHNPAVLQLVSQARAYSPGGRFAGYSNSRPTPEVVSKQVRTQAEAVIRALQKSGITYVSSIYTFGEHINQAQRIRLPQETLSLANANCMDVSVVFASAMENVGLQPVIVIIPGHAFTGVRLGPQSNEILYLDLTVLPKGGFSRAASRAQYWLKKTPPEQVITIDVAAARALGVYPLE